MTSIKAKRLDQLLVEKELYTTRHQAQLAIRSGNILVNDAIIDKPGELVSPSARINIKEKSQYVSRGGLKLEKALEEFNISVKNKIVCDIGCSTGGFTDCLLQNGAAQVYAIDVGYGQLALPLRNDKRVILKEKTNARYLTLADFSQIPELITIDVSFISLEKIFPAVSSLLRANSELIALIKPQFEAGPSKLKKGVVRDPLVHQKVIDKIKTAAIKNNLQPQGIIPSPLLGPKGNKEFLFYAIKSLQGTSPT